MPFDWVTFILVQNIGKPRPKRVRHSHLVKEKERREQMERNEINKRRVAMFLERTME